MVYKEDLFLWQAWKRRLLVFMFLTGVVCLAMIPLWQQIGIQPNLLLIILYYWCLYRPGLLSVEQLVLISLIQDGIYAYPLGFSALRLLVAYALLMTQKRILAQQRFLWVWGGFSLFVVLDALIYATLLSFVRKEWPAILSLIPGMLLTAGVYPLIVWVTQHLMMKRFSK